MSDDRWEAQYASGQTPWDGDVVSADLVDFVTSREGSIPASGWRVLELGCGTGTQAVWLASRRCAVVGIDLAPTAIAKARARAAAAGVQVDLRVGDVLEALPEGPFDLVFDRGLLHGLEGDEPQRLAAKVRAVLAPAGRWLSLLGSADEPTDRPGPPRWTLGEIAAALEPSFRVERVVATTFDDTTLGWSPRAWRVEATPR